eukprot:GHVS01108743.1.p1 GENE.GHVS01108743.1~~GHVS01108743.1.p1  ORF type:complete len:613 (+),score=38.31 GHVS01108743.1:130-1968(+)
MESYRHSASVFEDLEEELDHLDYLPGNGGGSERKEYISSPPNGTISSGPPRADMHCAMGSHGSRRQTGQKVIYSPPPQEQFASFRRVHLLICMTVFAILTSFVTILYVMTRYGQLAKYIDTDVVPFGGGGGTVSRIAFGSCLQQEIGSQPVWKSIISVQPHVYIWLGDFVYADYYSRDCSLQENAHLEECQCEPSYLNNSPGYCNAGNKAFAMRRFMQQVRQEDYQAFLKYMCPGKPIGLASGPQCTRPIIGTWDDHDFLWRDGNARLPNKDESKKLFLDAIMERQDSSRRSSVRGIEYKYVYNKGDKYKEVSVFLLDERYYKEPLPCATHWERCQDLLSSGKKDAYCEDFVKRGKGCCPKDDFMFRKTEGWCDKNAGRDPPHSDYEELCNPKSPAFGTRSWLLDSEIPTLKGAEGSAAFCDVLGPTQRAWLSREVASSSSRVNLIGSGSVLLTSNMERDTDSWGPYHSARKNIISTLIRTDASCVVVLTGDFHYGQISVLHPGRQHAYTEAYATENLKYPLYQVMSSGMTDEMVHWSMDENKRDDALADSLKLRDGEKSYVMGANFGLIDFDWYNQIMHLQVRHAGNGTVAIESSVDIRTCTRHKKIGRDT